MTIGGSPGTVGHEILSLLSFGEGDDITDAFLASQNGDQSVETEGNASMGWGTVFKGFEHVTETALDHIGRNLQDFFENLLLYIRLMDPDTSPAKFDPVEYNIVMLSANFLGS